MRPEPSFTDILALAEQGDAKACAALDKMAYHLGLGMAMLISGLAPNLILVIGEVTRSWNRVGPVIESVVAQHRVTQAPARILPADYMEQPRLRGTVAMVLQKHFGAPRIV